MEFDLSSVLILDDDLIFLRGFARCWSQHARTVLQSTSLHQALTTLEETQVELALIDLWLEEETGLQALATIGARFPMTACVVMSGVLTCAHVVEAMRLGAADCVSKGTPVDAIIRRLRCGPDPNAPLGPRPSLDSLEALERERINRVLGECGCNISEAARRLGIHRRTLQRKLRKYPSQ